MPWWLAPQIPLAVNKFDSERKRMSIVVKDKSGRIRLLCKGADTAMLKFGYCDTSEEFATVDEQLRLFAQEGLRTLVLGYRDLTLEEYQEWMNKYTEAAASAKNRDEQMNAVAKAIEKNMRIVGITAIEDKLQVRGGVRC
jgi:phospholipid-transporting ATPase